MFELEMARLHGYEDSWVPYEALANDDVNSVVGECYCIPVIGCVYVSLMVNVDFPGLWEFPEDSSPGASGATASNLTADQEEAMKRFFDRLPPQASKVSKHMSFVLGPSLLCKQYHHTVFRCLGWEIGLFIVTGLS